MAAPAEDRAYPVYRSRYDRWVAAMRLATTLVAGALGLVILLLPLMHEQPLSIHVAREKLEQHTGAIVVVAPRYRGVDEKGRPFMVSAARSWQATPEAAEMVLEELAVDLVASEGRTISLLAPEARYYPEEDRVNLDRLEGRSSDGYVFEAPAGVLALKERRLTLAGPVTGEGPLGRFEAEGAVYVADTRRLTLTGPVRLVITRQAKG